MTSTGVRSAGHEIGYRGPMGTDTDTDSDVPLVPRRTHRRGKLVYESDTSSDSQKGEKLHYRTKGKRSLRHTPRKGKVSSSEDEPSPKPRRGNTRNADRHLVKWCPVAGCRAKPQARLSSHIKARHHHIPKKVREDMCKRATPIRRKPAPPARPKDTPSIVSLFAKASQSQSRLPAVAEVAVQHSSTRQFPTFSAAHPELEKFRVFLKELDGGRKKESEVQQITADLNKVLRFCRPRGKNPVWIDLVDQEKVRRYVDHLQESGACGLSGQLTKLDRLVHGLRFLRLRVAGDDTVLTHRCGQMEERIKAWKATIRPQRKLQQQLKGMGDTHAFSLHDATAVLRCKQLWLDVQGALSRACTVDSPTPEDCRLVMSAVTTRIAYRSWQRPGAVTGATVDEFYEAVKETDASQKTCYVMLVARHKTARQGPASVTLTKQDHYFVQAYVRYVRLHCNPTDDSLFVGVEGKPITQLNRSIQWLGGKYGVATPTCTQLRKVGATEAALRCSETSRHLITSHMSHSEAVHSKYYVKIRGSKLAAKAHAERVKLAAAADDDSDDDAEPGPSKQKVQKTAYSDREVALIEGYFRNNIKKGRPVSPGEARAFLKKHPLKRTFKQIQDKVRNLLRSAT